MRKKKNPCKNCNVPSTEQEDDAISRGYPPKCSTCGREIEFGWNEYIEVVGE